MMWRSEHQIIVELYLLCTGGYGARLIQNVFLTTFPPI